MGAMPVFQGKRLNCFELSWQATLAKTDAHQIKRKQFKTPHKTIT